MRIRNAYWKITVGYGEATWGINSSRESVGFGLSVRAVRTGSPSGRTNHNHKEKEMKRMD